MSLFRVKILGCSATHGGVRSVIEFQVVEQAEVVEYYADLITGDRIEPAGREGKTTGCWIHRASHVAVRMPRPGQRGDPAQLVDKDFMQLLITLLNYNTSVVSEKHRQLHETALFNHAYPVAGGYPSAHRLFEYEKELRELMCKVAGFSLDPERFLCRFNRLYTELMFGCYGEGWSSTYGGRLKSEAHNMQNMPRKLKTTETFKYPIAAGIVEEIAEHVQSMAARVDGAWKIIPQNREAKLGDTATVMQRTIDEIGACMDKKYKHKIGYEVTQVQDTVIVTISKGKQMTTVYEVVVSENVGGVEKLITFAPMLVIAGEGAADVRVTVGVQLAKMKAAGEIPKDVNLENVVVRVRLFEGP